MKVGVNGAARDVSDLKVGVSGAVRAVSEAYVGVNGAVKKVWPLYKAVVVDSAQNNTSIGYYGEKIIKIPEGFWSWYQKTIGWLNYYALDNGPVYVYYNTASSAESAYDIVNGKFTLKSANLVTKENGNYYGRTGALEIFTQSGVKQLRAWLGFNSVAENSFDYIYNAFISTSDAAQTLGFGIGLYSGYSTMDEPGALNWMTPDGQFVNLYYSAEKYGLEKG